MEVGQVINETGLKIVLYHVDDSSCARKAISEVSGAAVRIVPNVNDLHVCQVSL